MNNNPKIFDRQVLRQHRDRASKTLLQHDFLFQEAVGLLNERLDDGNFERVLELGCRGDYLKKAMRQKKIDCYVQTDISTKMVQQAQGNRCVVVDEELLPFASHCFDLVLSALSLHWVNDLPGTLAQIHAILKPNAIMLANVFGPATLKELRQTLAEVEAQMHGGMAPRISPFADVKTLGGLMQRAGFAMPVSDSDVLTVSYHNVFDLLADIRGMGESNALVKRAAGLSRALLVEADKLYRQRYGDGEGGIQATFELVTITGLAAHSNT